MTYRNHLLAIAAQWKLGGSAARVLAMLPDDRREGAVEALQTAAAIPVSDLALRITKRAEREERRVMQWGRKRYGATVWDRLDPRVRKQLVQKHGRNY